MPCWCMWWGGCPFCVGVFGECESGRRGLTDSCGRRGLKVGILRRSNTCREYMSDGDRAL